ncbi:MAG TPA: glycosyltransferase family 1 protein [Chitinophagaceae bacterium]|nr:glycosyltransferase family 1 protein [Chitinophagaceae bacterium]
MNIGFDAKRAFHNQTGLGHYSRTLIHSLAKFYPGHQYYLFNPKRSSIFQFEEENVHEILPGHFPSSLFTSVWRSSWVKTDLKKLKIDLYHGLSHEIPLGIQNTNIRSVVTIHDLIHERYPEQYNPVDVKIYNKKFRYACQHADKIIAISEQTKNDIVEFYKTPVEKVRVTYQSCSPSFGELLTDAQRKIVCLKYGLPPKFFLYVGSIIERKNLLNICKAVFILRNESSAPLVVIGDGGKYKQQVKDFIKQNALEKKVIFLSEQPAAMSSKTFQNGEDLPAIYQSATALIYPSFFEGFGIPVLEGLWSRVPVITSNVSSLPEVGGNAVYYVNPQSAEEIAEGMNRICNDQQFAEDLRQKGLLQAKRFSQQNCAEAVMNVYESLML